VDGHAATFGEQLRRFRLRAGLSQTALAERANLSPATVTALERGARGSPYPQTLGALAEALQLSAEERGLLAVAARSSGQRITMPAAAQSAPPSNLSARRMQLIGREHDLQRVCALLIGARDARPSSRLITLTGVGGVGKTTLALEVAAELRAAFGNGAWLVELAPVVDAALVPRVVGAAVGMSDGAEAPPDEALVGFLRTRRTLLVLDNCEHLIDACAHLARRLLDGCPAVHLLVTSREPLLLPGEQQVRLQPLPAPEEADVASPERLAGNPAVQLLVTHAQAASADFRLTPEVAPAIARVCARLEGIPLALVLAAARLTVLSPQQLLDRLDDAFQLLSTRSRAAPTRQQTLRATLDWSYGLLTASEQAVFRRLGVFAGGCDLRTAEAVCALDDLTAADVLDLLARLVDKSLVMAEAAAGVARYRLLQPLRQYAAERLAACGEACAVERRHTAQYLSLAEQAASGLSGPRQIAWLARLDGDLDNLRAALHRVAQGDDAEQELRLVTALARYWEARGQLGEGRQWLEHAINRARGERMPTRLQRDALFGAARLAQWQADLACSAALVEESLALSRALDDHEAIAEELAWLGMVYLRQGDEAKARAALDESLAVGRTLGETSGHATACIGMGVLLGDRGDLAGARPLLESGVGLFRALGDLRSQAISLVLLGAVALEQQQPAQARAWLAEALGLLPAIGDPVFALFAVEGLADADVRAGQPARAARWLGATDVLRERLGARRALPDWPSWERMVAAMRSQLGEGGLAAALTAGRGLSLEELLAEAIPTLSSAPSEPGRGAGGRLTRREREVAELLQQGYSDREIAARLSITRGTAGLHVHRVLTKLELRSRWQVADWLRGAGLPRRDDDGSAASPGRV
jgi:non-specific serine/threonine protein kinase